MPCTFLTIAGFSVLYHIMWQQRGTEMALGADKTG